MSFHKNNQPTLIIEYINGPFEYDLNEIDPLTDRSKPKKHEYAWIPFNHYKLPILSEMSWNKIGYNYNDLFLG